MEYKTIIAEASAEFVERRSRFIGHIKPVQTEEDAISFINQIKSDYWDAAHNVYAYVLRNGQTKRYSDDGEPQGTAGIPALDVLLKSGVTDTVVVVTRYFGGVLLGAGGLVRAYSHSVSLALESARIVTMRECKQLELRCDYNHYGKISGLIPECNGMIDHTDFTDAVTVFFHMAEQDMEYFRKQLLDYTCGQVDFTINGENFYVVP